MDWDFLVVCVEKVLGQRKAIARGISEMYTVKQCQISPVNFARKVTKTMIP